MCVCVCVCVCVCEHNFFLKKRDSNKLIYFIYANTVQEWGKPTINEQLLN